ncbi:MAG: hypothetical protein J1F01_00945 [Oscillospiraceae bacterium]|nr:hypothetical protein [Oscillospiraceae bacterium]
MERIIYLTAVLICVIRLVNFGIYTVKDKNKTGGVSLFVMAIIAASTSVYFFMK